MPEERTRTLKVYDDKGDFTIQIPIDAKVTFGYFNPSRESGGAFDRYGNNRGSNVSRETALRIYEGKTVKSNQIACFIGVRGFRDDSISLVREQESVTIVTSYKDDGDGHNEYSREAQREMRAIPEKGVYN